VSTPVVPPRPSRTPSGGHPHQAEVMQPPIKLIWATVLTLLMYRGFTNGAGCCFDKLPACSVLPPSLMLLDVASAIGEFCWVGVSEPAVNTRFIGFEVDLVLDFLLLRGSF